ncbi:MAG: hypothetical protein WBD40_09375 [Tepidisphaeraceae bacterium]
MMKNRSREWSCTTSFTTKPHEGNRAVRSGEWKLVATHRQLWQLFNMTLDRTEQHDRAAEQPQRVGEMSKA